MQPGLATLVISADGRVDVKTWSAEDSRALPTIRYARQNGVPLRRARRRSRGSRTVRFAIALGRGQLVGQRQSRSADAALVRVPHGTQRASSSGIRLFLVGDSERDGARAAGLRLQKAPLHLDMNNPAWAYFGLWSNEGGRYVVEHPAAGMASKDSVLSIAGRPTAVPRFVGHADTANPGDFFYFMSRAE